MQPEFLNRRGQERKTPYIWQSFTLPEVERRDLCLSNYRKFMMEMVEKNFFHYAVEAAPTEFYFPGTSAKVVMTAGLRCDKIVGTFAKNLFYGHGER